MIGSYAKFRMFLLLSWFLGIYSYVASAQTDSTWNGGNGNWSTPAKWNNGVPNGNFNALISNGNPGTSTANLDINATIANLSLDAGNSLNILAGNTLTFQSATGSAIDNSGTISVASTGALEVGSGNTLSLTGAGALRLNGGSITGATGSESLTGGNIIGNGTISGLGFNSNGGITADGGTLTINPNSQGFFSSRYPITVNSGSTLNITGGPFKNFDPLTGTLSYGMLDLHGTLKFDNAEIKTLVSLFGAGNLTLDGSGARIVNQFNQNALANLSSIFSQGFASSGPTLGLVNGATLTTSKSLFNDYESTVSVSNGSALTIGGSLSDQGEIDLSGSSMTVKGDVEITFGDVVSKITVSNGSTLNVKGNFTLSHSTVNFLTIDSSAVTVGGDFSNLHLGGLPNNLISISNGGTLSVGGTLNNESFLALMGGSTLTVQNALNNSGSLSLSQGSAALVHGSLNNSGDVKIDNTSVLTVGSGFNQTAGSTVVNGLLNAPGTNVNIQGGAVSGTGVVNGNVLMAGTLMPGDPTGILTFNGNYSQTSSGTLMEQVGWLSGTNASLLRIMGGASLGGTLDLKLLNGYMPTIGDSFLLMTFGSSNGAFANINGLDVTNDLEFVLFYDPHDVRIVAESEPVATPEPGSFLLLAIGVLGLLACYRNPYMAFLKPAI